jgi:beta-glucosidase
MSDIQYPGVGVGKYTHSKYLEGLLIGHRWYDAMGITPRFEFGFGLSYMLFEYSALQVQVVQSAAATAAATNTEEVLSTTTVQLEFTVKNVGRALDGSLACAINGTEVPQLYLQFPVKYDEPVRQLKGFQK